MEAELAELPDSEAAEFLASYGLRESAVERLIGASYMLLGLISFFTVGEDECRAWTIRSGSTALEAAGEIHSDIQRGFIRAEVVKYEDLMAAGGLAEARSRAQLRRPHYLRRFPVCARGQPVQAAERGRCRVRMARAVA